MIPRERAISVEDFIRRYEKPNRPCILSGWMKEWPLFTQLKQWTEKVADIKFKVGSHEMAWKDFIEYSTSAYDEDPLYLFDKHFTKKYPAFRDMYTVPPMFSAERDLFSLLGEEERPDYQWLIAGGPCSGSPFHIGALSLSSPPRFLMFLADPNGTSAWNALLSGSKKWILAPRNTSIPGVIPNSGFGQVATPVSAMEWFVDFYHQMKELGTPVIEGIQRPGDIIFVVSARLSHLLLRRKAKR